TVSERGRSGADLIYGIADGPIANTSSTPQSTSPPDPAKQQYFGLPMNSYNWKAYSNPGHPFVLAANRETGALQALPQGSNLPAPWIILPKPTAEFHAEIANEFVSSLAEPLRTSLR